MSAATTLSLGFSAKPIPNRQPRSKSTRTQPATTSSRSASSCRGTHLDPERIKPAVPAGYGQHRTSRTVAFLSLLPSVFPRASPALSHDLPLSLYFISCRSPPPWSTLAGAPSTPRWPDPAQKQANPSIPVEPWHSLHASARCHLLPEASSPASSSDRLPRQVPRARARLRALLSYSSPRKTSSSPSHSGDLQVDLRALPSPSSSRSLPRLTSLPLCLQGHEPASRQGHPKHGPPMPTHRARRRSPSLCAALAMSFVAGPCSLCLKAEELLSSRSSALTLPRSC